MIFQNALLLSLTSLLVLSANSFTIQKTSPSLVQSKFTVALVSSTCLRAESDKETTEDTETVHAGESSSSNPANDILNSPAFLKRKVDVLKSDIAKTEEEIAAAKERLEAGKAEWGPQLEELKREVRYSS